MPPNVTWIRTANSVLSFHDARHPRARTRGYRDAALFGTASRSIGGIRFPLKMLSWTLPVDPSHSYLADVPATGAIFPAAGRQKRPNASADLVIDMNGALVQVQQVTRRDGSVELKVRFGAGDVTILDLVAEL
jgi:hypothetical protein